MRRPILLPTRRFGRTGLEMPVLSLGGMRYQYSWKEPPETPIPDASWRNVEAVVRKAIACGITHFETARGYGTSERQLGRALAALPPRDRERVILQTKFSPRENPDEFESGIRDSLARLGVASLELFALHGINNEEVLEWALRPGGCLSRARKLQKEGLFRHVGFSTHGNPEVILETVRHEKDGGFDYMNLHYYYIYQRNLVAIDEAARRDMGVFIISPSDKGGKLYEPSPEMRKLCAPFHPVVFNELFCLTTPGVHTVSVGAAKPSDIDLHLESARRLSDAADEVKAITNRLDAAWKEKLGADFAARFREGIPEWNHIPGEVNVKVILWLLNLAKAFGLVEYGRMRYKLLNDGGHWFPGRKAEKFDDEEIIRACSDSPWREKIPGMLREAHRLFT